MLFEKNTLFGPPVPWFTGCSAVSPGHLPFCARASISVPGAPASSLVTGSQELVLKPGVEICAPVCVATALLCTCQPAVPMSEMSLAPVSAGELAWTTVVAGMAGLAADVAASGAAWALEASQTSVMAETPAAIQRAGCLQIACLIAANSCPAAAGRTRDRQARFSNSSYTFQTNSVKIHCGSFHDLSAELLHPDPIRDDPDAFGVHFRVRIGADPDRRRPPPTAAWKHERNHRRRR